MIHVMDFLEIIFFSGIIYLFSVWLSTDKKKNLLVYFYCYCACIFTSYFLNAVTISTFLIYISPVALILFIIFHQDVLQRNFITLHTEQPIDYDIFVDWLENLIRTALYAINNNKQLICVIENESDLASYLQTSFLIQSPLAQNIMCLVIDSASFDQEKLFWCNRKGKLVAINASWNIPRNVETPHNNMPLWQQDALLMTLKTDTIVFKADPRTRNFDCVIKGILYQNVTAHNLIPLIKKNMHHIRKGDIIHENVNQKKYFEQQNY